MTRCNEDNDGKRVWHCGAHKFRKQTSAAVAVLRLLNCLF